MVVADAEPACAAGVEILRRGGNAADAAVAVGFALAVCYPSAGNLGGGGFLLYRDAVGEVEALDFRETAPGAATRDMFLDASGRPDPERSLWSPLAAGVPGTVAGLGLLHRRHGTLPWPSLLEPAIRLAREGFLVDQGMVERLRRSEGILARDTLSARIFLRDGRGFAPGDTLRQPLLAATLERIAREGPQEFYEGETARLLAEDMRRRGGLITVEDLAAYEPRLRKPLRGRFRGYTIFAMPPPSSGGVVILQILKLLEPLPLEEWGWGSAGGLYVLAEAMRRAFADRAVYMGDPDFVQVPVKELLAAEYVDSLRQAILADSARARRVAPGRPRGVPWPEGFVLPWREGRETTHFVVVDGDGAAASVTVTLNAAFGSGLTVAGAGFLLNNEMDDFAAAPGQANYYGLVQGEANAIAPGKRPLSSMTPVLVLRERGGREALYLALGSPGGPTIITSVLQVLLGVLAHGLPLQEAVAAPRMHHQWWPDTVYVEPWGWPEAALESLRERGIPVTPAGGYLGNVNAVLVDSVGVRLGVADPRRSGCARGDSR
jgi:gamma-glutamyltranspeptidase/glutathione hydrolase